MKKYMTISDNLPPVIDDPFIMLEKESTGTMHIAVLEGDAELFYSTLCGIHCNDGLRRWVQHIEPVCKKCNDIFIRKKNGLVYQSIGD